MTGASSRILTRDNLQLWPRCNFGIQGVYMQIDRCRGDCALRCVLTPKDFALGREGRAGKTHAVNYTRRQDAASRQERDANPISWDLVEIQGNSQEFVRFIWLPPATPRMEGRSLPRVHIGYSHPQQIQETRHVLR